MQFYKNSLLYFNILDAQDIDLNSVVVTFAAPLSIATGSQQCINFNPVDDSVLEGTHSLTLMISGTSVPTTIIVTPNTIVLTITDNEGIAIYIEFIETFKYF